MSAVNDILEECVAKLEKAGESTLAEGVRVVASTAGSDTLTVAEAAALAGVTHQTIKNWLARGVIAGSQVAKGRRHAIDKASLLAAIDRRRNLEAAKAAFESTERAVEFLTGMDAETIKRLGGV